MSPEEYLLASRAVHIELERLNQRVMELAKFRCAELSNQAFLNAMQRQRELLAQLESMHDRLAAELRNAARPVPH